MLPFILSIKHNLAELQNGYAAACKAVYASSILASASKSQDVAQVVKLVDTADLKSAAYLNKGRAGSIPALGTNRLTSITHS